jgi:uncharacterized membrane protein
MADPVSSSTPSSNRGVMIVLSYLWLLALVPLLVEKNDTEVQWHAKHGIVLMVAEIIVWIGFTIVTSILSGVLAPLGCLTALLIPVIYLAFLILHIMAIIKGINGGRLIIPGVSEYANRF